MRGAFILTALISLLVVGYLVIQNMDSHTRNNPSGQVEEIEQAREAADQAKEQMDAIRETVSKNK